MKQESPTIQKSFQFGKEIIMFYKSIKVEYPDIARQILRSGTSIGANIAEAQCAESKKDFIHKLSISLKEARETEYWLYLLKDIVNVPQSIFKLSKEVCALLTSSIKTLKDKNS